MTALTQTNRRSSYDPYGGPGCPLSAGGPSPLNLLYATADTVKAVYALREAGRMGDREGKRDAAVRICAAPATFFQAAASAIVLFTEYVGTWGILAPLVALIVLPLLVLGIGISILEFGFETLYAKRAHNFLQNFHVDSIEKLNSILAIEDPNKRAKAAADWIRSNNLDPKVWQQELAELNRKRREGVLLADIEPTLVNIRDELIKTDLHYLFLRFVSDSDNAQEAAIRRAELARRVMPWCADMVIAELPTLITHFNNTEGAARARISIQATQFLSEVTIQAKKKRLIHIMGMIGSVLTLAAFLCLFHPAMLLLVAAALITLSYMYGQGTLNERGWSFSIKKAVLPDFLIHWWDRQRAKREIAPQIAASRVALIPAA